MIRKSDVQWWVLEANQHPEAAPEIIEQLAQRLSELDAENERLRDEIIQLQRHAPAAAEGPELEALRRRVTTLQRRLEEEASTEPAVVFLSDRLEAARMPLPQAQRLAREDRPALGSQALLGRSCLMLLARPRDELLLLTSHGRGLKVLPPDIPTLAEGGDWTVIGGPSLAEGERATAAVAVAEPPRFWTVVTRRGFVRQFIRVGLDQRLARGDSIVESPCYNNVPVAIVDGDQGDLLLLTRWGQGVRFPQRSIAAQGLVALELDPDDAVVAALPLPADVPILIVTASGFAARWDTARFAARSRPGGAGKSLIQAYDVLGVFPCEPESHLLYLTYSGKLVAVSVADVPLHQRSRKGSRVRVFDRDPAVAVMAI